MRGDVSPLKVLTSFPAVKVPQATRRRVEDSKVDIQRRRGRVPRFLDRTIKLAMVKRPTDKGAINEGGSFKGN